MSLLLRGMAIVEALLAGFVSKPRLSDRDSLSVSPPVRSGSPFNPPLRRPPRKRAVFFWPDFANARV